MKLLSLSFALLKLLIDTYKNGEVDTIEIAYPSFVNVLVQEPVIQSLLPIVDLREVLDQLKKRVSDLPSLEARSDSREMVFEPSAEAVLDALPELYVKVIIHQLLLAKPCCRILCAHGCYESCYG